MRFQDERKELTMVVVGKVKDMYSDKNIFIGFVCKPEETSLVKQYLEKVWGNHQGWTIKSADYRPERETTIEYDIYIAHIENMKRELEEISLAEQNKKKEAEEKIEEEKKEIIEIEIEERQKTNFRIYK